MASDPALRATTLREDENIAETPFYIAATGTATRPRRTLKHGDMFEVRGLRRTRRGGAIPRVISADRVVLGYQGLDGEARRTTLTFDPPPTDLSVGGATYRLELAPGEMCPIFLAVGCNELLDQRP